MRKFRIWYKDFPLTAISWFIYAYFAMAFFWAQYNKVNPILTNFASNFAKDNRVLFNSLMYSHDALINLILALPAAFFLIKICKIRSTLVVALASLIVSILMNRGLSEVLFTSGSIQIIWGILVLLLALPVAFHFLSRSSGASSA